MKRCACGKGLHSKNQSGKCRPCFNAGRRKPRGNCTECGKQLGKPSGRVRTGLCRVCMLRRNSLEARADPIMSERLREVSRKVAKANFWSPEARAKWNLSRPDVGKKMTEARIGWCPPEYRDDYLRIMRAGHSNAARARRIIAERIREDKERDRRADARRLAVIHVSEAADFLRKYAPIKRLDDGTFQYGITILAPEELIERAQLRGWSPPEWSRAA